jgi:hypothetical protein
MCLFPSVYSSNFINKMQVKHYNHSSKGRIAKMVGCCNGKALAMSSTSKMAPWHNLVGK